MSKLFAVAATGGSLALFLLLNGCAVETHYAWGNYEQLVYDMYQSPGKSPPEREIEQMESDLQIARSQNKPLPPGFHAHLGDLYYQIGTAYAARQEFETEKAQFPESAVFMNRLLASMQRK